VINRAHGVYVPGMNIRMRRLTAELRRLRKEQGLTSRDVAKLLGISLATVSRIETIGLGLHRDALVELLTLYKVPRHKKTGLLQMLEQLNQPGLLDRFDVGVDDKVASWASLEQDAQRILAYDAMFVPGLLQTFQYAMAIFEAYRPGLTEEEVVNRTNLRIARQAVLRRRSLQYHVVMHEAALHTLVGGAEIMHGQLAHLVEVIEQRVVDLRVLPFDRGAHSGLHGAFVVADYRALPSLVLLENRVSGLYLEEKEDVATYRLCWQEVRELAHGSEESAALIKKVAGTQRMVEKGRGSDQLAEEQL
jgi:transcriptional regulator with XRE-family HTH domain